MEWHRGRGHSVRAAQDRTAYLGNEAQRPPGHTVHMLFQQTPKDTYTARCRSCRPRTHRGHYKGGWHPQGKLENGVEM